MRANFISFLREVRRGLVASKAGAAAISKRDLDALVQIFGTSATSVKVIANSRFAKLHRALATTRRNRIYLACSIETFLRDPKLMLHEYYHVLAQWNCGELSASRYVWESLRNGYRLNCYEIAACRFADAHLAEFERLRNAETSAEFSLCDPSFCQPADGGIQFFHLWFPACAGTTPECRILNPVCYNSRHAPVAQSG